MQWLMLQQEQAEDFVIATGVQYSVREFVELAAASWASRWLQGEGETRSARGEARRRRATRPSASPAT
jgi:GDPmannose 4,6-dehydratase